MEKYLSKCKDKRPSHSVVVGISETNDCGATLFPGQKAQHLVPPHHAPFLVGLKNNIKSFQNAFLENEMCQF
jgi:hypothetical protein